MHAQYRCWCLARDGCLEPEEPMSDRCQCHSVHPTACLHSILHGRRTTTSAGNNGLGMPAEILLPRLGISTQRAFRVCDGKEIFAYFQMGNIYVLSDTAACLASLCGSRKMSWLVHPDKCQEGAKKAAQ